MTKISCVTSMSKPYYDNIGQLMIKSWSKFWPEDCKLFVYTEGFTIEKNSRVIGINWEDKCYVDWLSFSKKTSGPSVRFAKKGFTMISAMETIDCDLLVWLDADTLTLQKFPKNKIESILTNEKLIAYFDTFYQIKPNYTVEEYLTSKIITAAESGFVILNKNHENFNDYLKEYKRLYTSKTKPIETQSWFDGHVCALAARNYRENILDLSNLRTRKKTQTPLNHCWIGEYVWHYKAKQKNNFDNKKYIKKLGL